MAPTTDDSTPALDPDELREALAFSFPDSEHDDALVASVLETVRTGQEPAPDDEPDGPLSFGEDEEDFVSGYYIAHAEHDRLLPIRSTFVGHLPQARLVLPKRDADKRARTPMGVALRSDRKLPSVAAVNRYLGRQAAERVELITAVRRGGARFGAIALYLCYREEGDAAPSFYFLEAGTATGLPKVLYYAPSLSAEVQYHTGYKPTPFSSDQYFYRGALTMRADDPNEPKELVVSVSERERGAPYAKITVDYERRAERPKYRPLRLIVEAVARIVAIGRAMDVKVGGTEKFAAGLRKRPLEWIHKPGS